METELPALPGAVPGRLPPLTSDWMTETSPRRPQQDRAAPERPKSSEILEELLNQGIIPIGQSRGGSGGAGEAYSIMLNDTEVRRRPPARLESLKAKKEHAVTSIEDIEEKIRLAEERRKQREDQLKLRLRAKSAHVRVRGPVAATEGDGDACVSLVEPPEAALGPDPLRDNHGAGGDGSEEGEEEDAAGTRVEEFLVVQAEVESDSSFQHADKPGLF
ncbi:stathmin domain-containing protein 1 isoform X2 [Betta splendens]|nr:stathmin domain-containing protein 1 isoform X2 [Betta splendens]